MVKNLTGKGLFVTFEGGEGAGKSTLARRLQQRLQEEGREVVLTREPGGTPFGEELRSLLLHKSDEKIAPRAELFLFLASRIQHIEEVIQPALQRGAIVLCDRFSDSTIAYQGEGKGLGFDYVLSCCEQATNGFEPHCTFYIDLDPHAGLLRTDKRREGTKEKRDRIEQESLDFHSRVKHGFHKLSHLFPKRIYTLDGSLDPESLFTQSWSILCHFLRVPLMP